MYQIFCSWLPLALSWFFMALELPLIASVLARLPDAETHLASFGGIAFPIAMLIEAPIIMLLAASTALCVDTRSYRKVYRFMMWSGATLTLLHILITFSPLFGVMMKRIIAAPEALHSYVQMALICLIPWTWSIAHRRFHQGILIRFGDSKSVGIGTFCRLVAILSVLSCGLLFPHVPGSVWGGLAASCGVLSEAYYISRRAHRIIADQLASMPEAENVLTTQSFLSFYIPLSLTSILGFLTQPIGSAAMSRMPFSVESLAVWPVVSGFTFLFRCWGHGIQEITVSRISYPEQRKPLFQFTLIVAAVTCGSFLFIALTPAGHDLIESMYGLSPLLTDFCTHSLVFFAVMPITSAFGSYLQGILVYTRRTRHITEAIILFLCITTIILWWGIEQNTYPALYVTVFAMSCGVIIQSIWLSITARRALRVS